MSEPDRFKRARDKGCAYLLEQLGPNGTEGAVQLEIGEYYKVLTAFQVCGQSSAANHLCDWIRRRGMTSEGDFGPRSEAARGYAYAYYNAWVIVGAHRLGQFDLSHKGMTFLMGFWDSESQGFYSSLIERSADTQQDLMVVSMCGLAAAYTGKMDVAIGVGYWLKRLMEAQPNFPNQLHTVYSRDKGLHTDPRPHDDLRYVLCSDATRDQAFFNPGIAAGFLCRLFQASGDNQWLELAKEYMRFAESASDYLFRLVRAGKVGWAASVLYTLTGEEKYKKIAIRIGDSLIQLQADQGHWCSPGGNSPSNDSTAERVVWMDEIYQAVGNET